MTAASTWGATLNRARQVYNAVVRPAMTYAAAIWHTPNGLRGAQGTHARHLEKIQNGCLRRVLGAYKATNTRILEAKAEIPPMQITLNEAIIRSLTTRGIHPITRDGNSHIKRKLKRKRGRKQAAKETPAEEKKLWTLRALRLDKCSSTTKPDQTRYIPKARKAIRDWRGKVWASLSTRYQSKISGRARTPAQRGDL